MALKLRRDARTFTNRWPPQKNGADSFKRVLGSASEVLGVGQRGFTRQWPDIVKHQPPTQVQLVRNTPLDDRACAIWNDQKCGPDGSKGRLVRVLAKPAPRNRHDRTRRTTIGWTELDEHIQLERVAEPGLDSLLLIAESPFNLLGLRWTHFALPNGSRLICGAECERSQMQFYRTVRQRVNRGYRGRAPSASGAC